MIPYKQLINCVFILFPAFLMGLEKLVGGLSVLDFV